MKLNYHKSFQLLVAVGIRIQNLYFPTVFVLLFSVVWFQTFKMVYFKPGSVFTLAVCSECLNHRMLYIQLPFLIPATRQMQHICTRSDLIDPPKKTSAVGNVAFQFFKIDISSDCAWTRSVIVCSGVAVLSACVCVRLLEAGQYKHEAAVYGTVVAESNCLETHGTGRETVGVEVCMSVCLQGGLLRVVQRINHEST